MRVELRGIHKSFGPVHANDGVSLTAESGSVHGLLGENGAGKSTLMKILSGSLAPDGGQIVLDGRPVRIASPGDAIRLGIGMLHQDPLDFPRLTVLDNFLLGSPAVLIPDRRRARAALETLGGQFGFLLDPDALCRDLGIGERQQLEILRLLWLGAEVLIFDEPTTAISEVQRIRLFAALRELAGEGKVIFFVSHKLEEVEALCDRVTVLRRGVVAGRVARPYDRSAVIRMMFGQDFPRAPRPRVPLGGPVLELRRVALSDARFMLQGVSFAVRAGEVVGLAGLEGSGQRLFLHACAGLVRPLHGEVRVAGRNMTGRPYRDFLAAGVAYRPAGRLGEGLVPELTLAEHVAVTSPRAGVLVNRRAAAESAGARIAEYNIRGGPYTPVDALSGGNQQRTLLALLPPRLTLLLMEHPTRGLDLEASEDIWRRLLERRREGTAIIFASSDLDELLDRSDRIVVFSGGRIAVPVDARETTVEQLGALIGGAGF